MTAAVRETPDGLCLVDPLDVRSAEDAAAVRQFDEELAARHRKGWDNLRRLLRDDRENEQGPSH